jgi:hypothetical protein
MGGSSLRFAPQTNASGKRRALVKRSRRLLFLARTNAPSKRRSSKCAPPPHRCQEICNGTSLTLPLGLLRNTIDQKLILCTLQMALIQRRSDKGFVHHSGRRTHYAAHLFSDAL